MSYIIRAMQPSDWQDVRRIYLAGIASGHSTFETQAPAYADWDATHRPDCRLVVCHDGAIAGWAALSPVSPRAVYRGVAEVSIYIDPAAGGHGAGTALLTALIAAAECSGVWTLQSAVFPENTASLRLHEKCGFRTVGRREKLGQTADGRWRDIILLERRSPTLL